MCDKNAMKFFWCFVLMTSDLFRVNCSVYSFHCSIGVTYRCLWHWKLQSFIKFIFFNFFVKLKRDYCSCLYISSGSGGGGEGSATVHIYVLFRMETGISQALPIFSRLTRWATPLQAHARYCYCASIILKTNNAIDRSMFSLPRISRRD